MANMDVYALRHVIGMPSPWDSSTVCNIQVEWCIHPLPMRAYVAIYPVQYRGEDLATHADAAVVCNMKGSSTHIQYQLHGMFVNIQISVIHTADLCLVKHM